MPCHVEVTLGGAARPVDVPGDSPTAGDLLRAVAEAFGPGELRLLFAGRALTPADAGRPLADLGISDGARLMALATSAASVQQVRAAREDPLVFNDFDAAEVRRRQLLQQRAQAQGARPRALPQYRFERVRALDGLPERARAEQILRSLAEDPGVLAVLAKHRWTVGCLSEMYPEGQVGVDPVCVLGLNKNHGQEILLRLRTDDLRSFRKPLTIKKVLFHELAHNDHSEHDEHFYRLMRQVERECGEMDWTGGGGLSSAAAPTAAAAAAVDWIGGPQVLGGGEAAGSRLLDGGGGGGGGGAGGGIGGAAPEPAARSTEREPEPEPAPDADMPEAPEEPELPDDVAQLAAMGFSEASVRATLAAHGGSVEAALEQLLAGTPPDAPPPVPAPAAAAQPDTAAVEAEPEPAPDAEMPEAPEEPELPDDVAQLAAMGFSEASARAALAAHGGSVEAALEQLLTGTPPAAPAPAPAPAAPAGGSREADILAATEALFRERTPAGARAAAELLILLLQNILDNPDEPRFQQVRLSNKRVQRAIGGSASALALLRAVGFEGSGETLEWRRRDAGLLWLGRSALEGRL